jgi:hypothetical protein
LNGDRAGEIGGCKIGNVSAKGTIEEIQPVWDFLVTW